MKTRFTLTAAAILIAMMFAMNGCGSNNTTIVYIESNESNDSNDGDDGDVSAQFEKGVALFGHDVETGTHFSQHLNPKMGAELAKTPYGGHSYASMTPIWVGGKQYVMGHSHINTGTTVYPKYTWFIQRIFPSGDFGSITDTGYFTHYYGTLITLTTDAGPVYIYRQRGYDDYMSYTQEVLPGGKLASQTSDSFKRAYYYDATTALPVNDIHRRTCFYAQDSDDGNHWIIDCIYGSGQFTKDRDSGNWDHGWQVALSYQERGESYIFGHRHRTIWDLHENGPWYIQSITDDSTMGSETDSGTKDNGHEWHNYYKTMTTFYSPEVEMQYLIGHNTDKNWFIQHVSASGTMEGLKDSGGPWAHYYEHLFPIDFDTSYLATSNWMGRMFDEIEGFGDRNLSQIALPASHDSGMNGDDIHGCSAGGSTCNTQTQYEDIGGQLSLGARYFDIRPMIQTTNDGSDWTTGHAGKLGTDITAGCRGEAKFSIIDNLKDFFADGKHSKELVILKISHCMSPPGNGYDDCKGTQISEMASNLAWHLGDLVVEGDDLDLNSMTLNEILDKGNIILVVSGARDRANGIFAWGYGTTGDYYVYDNYSNTEEFAVMVYGGTNNSKDSEVGQIKKLLDPKNHSGNYDGFLLSWTLTLSEWDATWCPSASPSDILEMAVKAQPRIYEYMYKEVEAGRITKTLFPNLLYVDTFGRTTTNAAIYLNRVYGRLND